MSFSIVFHPDVESDVHESFIWYENNRIGLGNEFILSLEATLENIRRNPARFLIAENGTRKALLFRFPFVVIYQLLEDMILILAVLHSRRNPESLHHRLE
jgi:plasmid stabilization system protein ParE